MIPSVTEFRILDQKSVSQQVFEELRHRTVQGQLQPGTRLNEARIAQNMGISRAPVREAVQRLRQEGLVIAKPRHGPVVAEITGTDAGHLYRVRCALEELAVVLLMEQKSRDGLGALKSAVGAMTEASRAGDVAQVVEQDVRFHETLCEYSGNPLLRRIYQTISAQFRIAAIQDDSREARLPEIADAHAQLLEAIERGDVAAAVSTLRHHILNALPSLVAHLEAQTERRHDVKL